MPKHEKVFHLLFLLFFVTLFISWLRVVNIIITAAIVIYSYQYSSVNEKFKLLKRRKTIQAMLFFFLLICISLLLSDNLSKGLQYLTLRLPLFLFPASIGLIYLRKEFKEKVLLDFAWTTTVICLLCLASAVYNYISSHRSDALYNDNLTAIIGQQSIYIALLVNFAVYIFLNFILFRRTQHKTLLVLAVAFLLIISYLLGSRINLAALLAISGGMCFYYIIQQRKILEGMAFVLILAIGAFLILKFQPLMFNRYKELAYSNFDYENKGGESHYNMELTSEQWNGANFRLAAWKCGWELFQENPVIGVSLGDKKDQLIQKYRQKSFHFAIETNKNVHNNYLDILYSMGLIGLAAFLIAWLSLPIISAVKSNDILAVVMILSIASAWITEIYFDRSFGGMITGFFIPFLLTDKKKRTT